MPFTISDLSFGIIIRDDRGKASLLSRRTQPIAEFSPEFLEMETSVPMLIWEVSYEIYQDPALWALIADWNKITSPAQYFIKHFSRGTRFRYLPLDVMREYNTRKRTYNLNGAGEVDLSFTS